MKKLILLLLLVASVSSCYNTRLYMGDVKKTDPVVKVNTQWNGHFLFGLVAGKNARTQDPSQFVNGASNYVVKTRTTFVDGLISVLTCGIYTPTQTVYYLPVKDGVVVPSKKAKKQ